MIEPSFDQVKSSVIKEYCAVTFEEAIRATYKETIRLIKGSLGDKIPHDNPDENLNNGAFQQSKI